MFESAFTITQEIITIKDYTQNMIHISTLVCNDLKTPAQSIV